MCIRDRGIAFPPNSNKNKSGDNWVNISERLVLSILANSVLDAPLKGILSTTTPLFPSKAIPYTSGEDVDLILISK